MNIYANLHAAIHAQPAPSNILHDSTAQVTSIAWNTPKYEFYALASPNTSRASMMEAANKLFHYAKQEEQRIFIVGGAIF